jgi:hypothetical protein
MDSLNNKERYAYLLSFSILSIFLYCGLYALPSADDYFYANLVKEYGFFSGQIQHYIDWNGRYSATFLITLFAQGGYAQYWLVPWVCIFSLFGALYFFLRILFSSTANQHRIFLFSLSLVALFLSVSTAGPGHGIKVVNEGFYWYSGAITYVISLALYFILLVNFIRIDRQNNRVMNLICSLFLLVTIIGLNETAMFLVCFTIIPLLFLRRHQLGNKTALVALFVIVTCSCVVVFAPGNSVRMDTSDGGSIISAIWICFEKLAQILFFYLFNPFVWIFSIAFFKQLEGVQTEIAKNYFPIKYLFWGGALLIFLLYLPVAYSLNSGAPDRLVAFIGFFALLISLFYVQALYKWVITKNISKKILLTVLITSSLLSSYYTINPLFVVVQTVFTAHNYQQLHRDREKAIAQQKLKGKQVITVAPIARNELLLFEDLLPGTENIEYAKYFGVKAVLVSPEANSPCK